MPSIFCDFRFFPFFLHLQCICKQSSDLILNRLYHHFLKSRSKTYWHTDEMTLHSTKLWFEWKVHSDDCNILKVSVCKKIIKGHCRGWYVFIWTSLDCRVSDCAPGKGPWQWLMLDSMTSHSFYNSLYIVSTVLIIFVFSSFSGLISYVLALDYSEMVEYIICNFQTFYIFAIKYILTSLA